MNPVVTVFRAHGLRVVIFLDDHEPAHVHVFGDGHAKIDLGGSGVMPKLLWADGMTKSEMRRAMKIVTEQRYPFLAKWSEIHG